MSIATRATIMAVLCALIPAAPGIGPSLRHGRALPCANPRLPLVARRVWRAASTAARPGDRSGHRPNPGASSPLPTGRSWPCSCPSEHGGTRRATSTAGRVPGAPRHTHSRPTWPSSPSPGSPPPIRSCSATSAASTARPTAGPPGTAPRRACRTAKRSGRCWPRPTDRRSTRGQTAASMPAPTMVTPGARPHLEMPIRPSLRPSRRRARLVPSARQARTRRPGRGVRGDPRWDGGAGARHHPIKRCRPGVPVPLPRYSAPPSRAFPSGAVSPTASSTIWSRVSACPAAQAEANASGPTASRAAAVRTSWSAR